MAFRKLIGWLIELPATLLNHLQDLLALFVRLYAGWQFFHAGWLKINAWDSTLFLFRYEYRVPVLSPDLAAVLGTAGELLFPALLWIGLTSRLAGIGLQFVNVMAVVSYAHVIFNPEFGTSAIADHYLWGLMILMVIIYGPGRLSADELLARFKSSDADVISSGSTAANGAVR